jgi:hypothetical protein
MFELRNNLSTVITKKLKTFFSYLVYVYLDNLEEMGWKVAYKKIFLFITVSSERKERIFTLPRYSKFLLYRVRNVRRLRWLSWSACRTLYLAIPLWSTYSQHTLLSNGENRLVPKPAACDASYEIKFMCPLPLRRATMEIRCLGIILCDSPCLVRRSLAQCTILNSSPVGAGGPISFTVTI